jgi:hypothetical protein
MLRDMWHRMRDIQKHRHYDRKYWTHDVRTRQSYQEYLACSERKEKSQIDHELGISRTYWGCAPFFYYRYGLYRQDRPLSAEQIRQYLPEFLMFDVYFPIYNYSPLANVVSNKIACSFLFQSTGVRKAKQIGYTLRGHIYDQGMGRLDEQGFLALLDRLRGQRIFIKPEDGKGGHGVLALDIQENGKLVGPGEEEWGAARVVERIRSADMIMELGLTQREEIHRINPHSINTFRIATECVDGRARIVYSSLRIGTGAKAVDNFCQDGLVVGLDSETGHFQPRAINQWAGSFDRHPESGFVFKDSRVEAWPEIREFILDAAERLPFFRHLGWDIALTDAGPVAIETNMGWDVDLPQLLFGGVRDLLRIPAPEEVWRTYRDRRKARPSNA